MKALADAHQLLGINHNASKQEISKAYKELARIYHPDKWISNPERATEEFKKLRDAYDLAMQNCMKDEPAESRNTDKFASSANNSETSWQPQQPTTTSSNAAAWLCPDDTPTFEVAYKREQWYPVNEEISKQLYEAYLAGIPGRYTEPGGNRQYTIDWHNMTQINIDSQRERSIRFRGLPQEANRSIVTGKIRKTVWSLSL